MNKMLNKLSFKIDWFLVLVVLVALPTVFPLLKPGLFTMHDDQQVVRLWQLDKALTDGHIPARWVSDLGFGFGYPVFVFYPPFIYYLGLVFKYLLFLSYVDAVKLVFAFGLIGSAVSMYYWARYHLGKWPGFVAATAYTYLPYKAVDAYVRGALAELVTFVWLPFIFLLIDRIFVKSSTKEDKSLIGVERYLLGLVLGVLVLTHNLIALPVAMLIPFYVLLRLFFCKARMVVITNLIVSALMGLAVSAFFWIPALTEKQFTLVDNILLTEKYTYTQHFAYPDQLWNSLWGYGGSTAGKLDGFTLKIGKTHVVASVFVVFITVFLYISKKNKKQSKAYQAILGSGLLLLVSAWLTTDYSLLVWESFPPLHYLQFPWRFLTFTGLFSSFLCGGAVYLISNNKFFSWSSPIIGLLIIAGVVLPGAKLFTPQTYSSEADDQYYTSDEFAKWHISGTSFEFVPKKVATTTDSELGITQLDISRDEVPTSIVNVNEGTDYQVLIDKTHHKKVKVTAENQTTFGFNTFYYPGWKLYLDGQEQEIFTDPKLYTIKAIVPRGEHELAILFTRTPWRTWSEALSLFTLISCLALITNSKRAARVKR